MFYFHKNFLCSREFDFFENFLKEIAMGGAVSSQKDVQELVDLQGKVVVIHSSYCKNSETSLRMQYDWSMDTFKIFDGEITYFYTDYRVAMSRKKILLDSNWNPIGNIKKKGKCWRIYGGSSSEVEIGEVVSLKFLSCKMVSLVKLRNGEVLEILLSGKGMTGHVWIGREEGVLVGLFDYYNDNDCNIRVAKGMDIALVTLLFLIYHSSYRR